MFTFQDTTSPTSRCLQNRRYRNSLGRSCWNWYILKPGTVVVLAPANITTGVKSIKELRRGYVVGDTKVNSPKGAESFTAQVIVSQAKQTAIDVVDDRDRVISHLVEATCNVWKGKYHQMVDKFTIHKIHFWKFHLSQNSKKKSLFNRWSFVSNVSGFYLLVMDNESVANKVHDEFHYHFSYSSSAVFHSLLPFSIDSKMKFLFLLIALVLRYCGVDVRGRRGRGRGRTKSRTNIFFSTICPNGMTAMCLSIYIYGPIGM